MDSGKNLRTLKDLEIDAGHYGLDETHNIEKNIQIALKWKKELRQEAIKWIKVLKCREKDTEEWIGNKEINQEKNEAFNKGIIATIEWIKHFFNIGESDLK